MRILMVCNFKPGVGGISGQVELLQRKLRDEGHAVDVFSTKATALKRLFMKPKLRRVSINYDLIHVHCCSGWGFLPAVLGISVAKQLNKRVVVTYHGGGGEAFFDRHPGLVQRYLTKTDANIVLSGFLAKVFKKHQLPFTIIPNIVELDSSQFKQREIIHPRYICVRAHEPLYNIPCVLRAFRLVCEKHPEASLVLVGNGSEHDRLMQLTERMGLKNVTYTGRVDNCDIYRYLDQADVMLSAPVIDNMPVSLLEAMNAGLLVISSKVGGVPYMIEDKINGLLFESNHEEDLADRMLWTIQHQAEVKSMIAQGRHSVRKYQWKQIKDKLYSVYGFPS